jgi:hypothetical protein
MAAQDPGFAIEFGRGILDVDVIDTIGELADELDGINALPQ